MILYIRGLSFVIPWIEVAQSHGQGCAEQQGRQNSCRTLSYRLKVFRLVVLEFNHLTYQISWQVLSVEY